MSRRAEATVSARFCIFEGGEDFKDFNDLNAAVRENGKIKQACCFSSRFALSLNKIGYISAKHTSKLVVFALDLHYLCCVTKQNDGHTYP